MRRGDVLHHGPRREGGREHRDRTDAGDDARRGLGVDRGRRVDQRTRRASRRATAPTTDGSRPRFGSPAGTMSSAAWYGHHRFRIGMMNDSVAIIGPRRAGMPDDQPVLAAR